MPHTRHTQHAMGSCDKPKPKPKPPPPPAPPPPPPLNTSGTVGSTWCADGPGPPGCYLCGPTQDEVMACMIALCPTAPQCAWSCDWYDFDNHEWWQATTGVPFNCAGPHMWNFMGEPPGLVDCENLALLFAECACSP